MGGRQGHSCLTRRDDGPQERDADPWRALQLDVGPRARGRCTERACSQDLGALKDLVVGAV